MNRSSDQPDADPARAPSPRPEPERHLEIDSESLLQGEREVLIRHGEDVYRLIRTRNGKLLLNKG